MLLIQSIVFAWPCSMYSLAVNACSSRSASRAILPAVVLRDSACCQSFLSFCAACFVCESGFSSGLSWSFTACSSLALM